MKRAKTPMLPPCFPPLLLLLSAVSVWPLQGQALPCPYEQCALRIEYRMSGPRVVEGREAREVGRLTAFGGTVTPLAESSDSAIRHLYRAFRQHRSRGATLNIASFVTTTVGVFLISGGRRNESQQLAGLGVLLGGMGLSIGSAHHAVRAHNQLSRAIWLYNEHLPR